MSAHIRWMLLLSALVFAWSGHLQILAAPASAPAPAPEPLAISANITGSLGNLCSSQPGVLSLIQGSAANQDRAGLAVAVPASLTNAVAVQQIAQVGKSLEPLTADLPASSDFLFRSWFTLPRPCSCASQPGCGSCACTKLE